MGRFFRNPEIRLFFILSLLAAVIFGIMGFLLGEKSGILLIGVSLFYSVLFLFFTYFRYRKLRRLSNDLDRMLHNGTPIPFDQYKEGELAVLESELSKMTLRLKEQADALERDKKYLSDSMADISHQLRSPLTAMELTVSLLKTPELEEERRRELCRELAQSCARISWLTEALLKMSKMDAGTAYLSCQRVELQELLRLSLEPLLIPMELREQTLDVCFETGRESFDGDIAWTTEAVQNILKNCMEHTPQGGTITVTGSENPLFTELIIEDNGAGFDKKDLPHLFERFYKGENASDQSIGIGLALARMIIAEQNGTVKAENRPEGGARFVVRFYKEKP